MKKINNGLRLRFDRVLSHNLLKQVVILLAVLFVVFWLSFALLSFSGTDWEGFCEERQLCKWLLPLYLLIDANALNNLYMSPSVGNGWMLVASSIIYLLGVVIFNGMIISVITNTIARRVDEHRSGLIHYLKSGHYIIMGYDDMVPSFVSYIFEKDKDAYVLILSSVKAEDIREKLRKSFSERQMKQMIINYGHRTSTEAYHDIHLEAAEQVYIVGYRSTPAHDAINVECVDSICRYLNGLRVKQHPSRIVCVFRDLDTYAAFQTSEIFGKVKELDMEFVPYNFHTGWARQVFVNRCYRDMREQGQTVAYPAVYGRGITPEDHRFVHLVFVGTTNFTVAFAMEAAHVLHFPNFCRDSKLKTRITFIDLNADKEKDEFMTRNRHFFEVQSYRYQDLSAASADGEVRIVPPSVFCNGDGDFLDVEFEFVKGDVFSERVQSLISQWASDTDHQYLSIFLALNNQRSNFVMGMNMPDSVYDHEIPVFIRQDRSDNFVQNLRLADTKTDEEKLTYSVVREGRLVQQKRGARYAHIYPFGMNEASYSEDEASLMRAKLINYLYTTADYEHQQFRSMKELNEMSVDAVMAEADRYWKNDLNVALKWSNLYGAYTMMTKLTTLRAMRGLDIDDKSRDYDLLTDAEVEKLAEVEHNRWNVEKLLMGYRKPRKEEDKYENHAYEDDLAKNRKLFIHHHIRPYRDLDVTAELDKAFTRYIPWLLKMTERP